MVLESAYVGSLFSFELESFFLLPAMSELRFESFCGYCVDRTSPSASVSPLSGIVNLCAITRPVGSHTTGSAAFPVSRWFHSVAWLPALSCTRLARRSPGDRLRDTEM